MLLVEILLRLDLLEIQRATQIVLLLKWLMVIRLVDHLRLHQLFFSTIIRSYNGTRNLLRLHQDPLIAADRGLLGGILAEH